MTIVVEEAWQAGGRSAGGKGSLYTACPCVCTSGKISQLKPRANSLLDGCSLLGFV
jgi:hypothetical protein